MILIFYYDIFEDYVFYDRKTFYTIDHKGKRDKLFYSLRLEFICEVM